MFYSKKGGQCYCSQECFDRAHTYQCVTCGREFVTENGKKYCSRECRIRYDISGARYRYGTTQKVKITTQEVADVNREALAHGMSYGQYVAMKEAQKNERR